MTDQPLPPDENSPSNDQPEVHAPSEAVALDIGKVVDLQIEDELKDSYLTYAMSTIMDRALPDVRDGLKPSQRRILVAMHDLNLRPGRKHLKCAKICGDTSGNYHPHGESVIYPTLVGMAQPWKMSAVLIDSQGNFGSIDGDPPAAMRYTEARMHHAAVDMLEDIKLDTVDFQPNYDDRLMEPMVLPGKFPNLLINGGVGIAVGMATSLVPHNPGEIFDAIVATIDNPAIDLLELLKIVPGPDFPTGGVIRGRRGILEGYSTGRGKLYVRGKVHVEPRGKKDSGLEQLVIDQIPYQLIQTTLMERIVSAVKEEKIKDIVDVRNESGRGAQTRIVCELRRGTDPAVVENQLYQHTPLQSTISIMNIALVNRQPRTLSLKEMIEHYIAHREDVIVRRTKHLLHEARKRAHLLEGMIYAVCDIDEVIALIRGSRTREEAIEKLAQRRFRIAADHEHAPKIPARLLKVASSERGVAMSRVQAEAIGSMRLIQLVGLEIDRLVSDYRKVVEEIEEYEAILGDRGRILAMIKEDCAAMKARYNRPRRTVIEEAEAEGLNIGALIQEGDVAVTISHRGWVKRVPLETYRQQGRGGRGIIGAGTKDEDFVEQLFVASTHDDLLCFTDTGRVFKIKVYEIPEMSRTSPGRPIVNLIDLREGEKAVRFMPISDFERGEYFLFFSTASGKIKRSSLRLYQNVNKSGIIAVGLEEGDTLIGADWTSGHDDILLVTRNGMSIRFAEDDARPMGRSAAGVRGIDLGDDDAVVGLVVVRQDDPNAEDPDTLHEREPDLLTVTENGYGKRTNLREYLVQSEGEDGTVSFRRQSRGGKGRIDIRTTERNGKVVAVASVTDENDLVFVTRSGMIVRIPAGSVSTIGRATQGVRLVSVKKEDVVISAAATPPSEDGDEEGGSPGGGSGGGDPEAGAGAGG
ncbi:MAG: DNA gyrase subunit A [Phycisphaerales bacterium]